MSEELDSLRAEVAALRAELAEQRAKRDRTMSRRRLVTGLAGAGAMGAAGLVAAKPAAADDLDPLVLGADNVAFNPTTLTSESPTTFSSNDPDCTLNVENTGSGFAARFQHGIHSFGIIGVSGAGFNGVVGTSDDGTGVVAIGEDDAFGLHVTSEHATAVQIESVNGPHIVFEPVDGVGPTDGHLPIAVGSLTVDANLDLWLCTAAGEPPTWTRLLREDTAAGRTVPVTPFRALDSRAAGGRPSGAPVVPGQTQGPLRGSQAVTLDLAGAASIPATATGVLGNLTVLTPSYDGYLRAAPSGTSVLPSAINFTKGATVANAFTSALGSDGGLTLRANGSSANTYHLLVDITAYIT